MNAYTIKRATARLNTPFRSNLNIQGYGRDNDYPQRMKKLILNSPTGATCMERYQTFIEGNGLYDTAFSEFICNRGGQTVDDILRLVATDIAYYGGFALRVYYDATCKIIDVQHLPFECCRLEEEDDNGFVSKVAYHPSWDRVKTRKGKVKPVDEKNTKKFYRFNPMKEVVLSQMQKDGGIDKYRGQVLYVSLEGDMVYPRPVYDKVVTNLSIDEGLDNIKYRNVRNNFLLSGMIVRKKGAAGIDGDIDYDEYGNEIDDADEFTDALREFQGDDNACSIMEVTVNADEDIPQFVKFEGENFDKKYTVTEASTVERIYSAFGQEPWYTLRIGKVGFSGDILAQAYEYYNSYVQSQRRVISRALRRIFREWTNGESAANATGNYDIQPLVYVANTQNGINEA